MEATDTVNFPDFAVVGFHCSIPLSSQFVQDVRKPHHVAPVKLLLKELLHLWSQHNSMASHRWLQSPQLSLGAQKPVFKRQK